MYRINHIKKSAVKIATGRDSANLILPVGEVKMESLFMQLMENADGL